MQYYIWNLAGLIQLSWLRMRLLLVKSKTCLNQHQG